MDPPFFLFYFFHATSQTAPTLNLMSARAVQLTRESVQVSAVGETQSTVFSFLFFFQVKQGNLTLIPLLEIETRPINFRN